MSAKKTKVYNPEEVQEMAAAGYVTPRQAAETSGFSLAMVYRAIKAKKVKAKIGASAWNVYVHRESWTAYVARKRAEAADRLGMAGVRAR